MNIKPLRDVVLFQFLDITEGKKGRFSDRLTPGGILIAPSESRQRSHRWGRVYAVGPDAELDVKPGEYILIEALMWMEGVKLDDGSKVWKTDPSKILMVTTDIDETYQQV